ncbi:MAG: bifunctional diaminohydroxyphosphoribosylaminopyrimidine deaminase/5-amino-6-(5-phosphoribosylamino)uracil reductase RibD [Pseudomonadales bacterium]|nr:bifunctional diaminohydroxyphosphoribosylaminopyrimidine deaminase/5-amino-6-(5-phosphoribosylamino)uracil reductase RibD [Pseudomonadales bacterium]
MSAVDIDFMEHCFALAERGRFTAMPNPVVGCVIVQNGQVVAEGWHEKAGGPHAEIKALDRAGAKARGASLYVSLEPCAHHGRTGPCSERIIAAGLARVIFGMTDPNPLVAGKGIEKIRSAGIAVSGPLLQEAALALNPGFVKRMTRGLPLLRCKLAMSLDGRTAMASGESKWITGPQARADVQLLRARSSAVISGIDTLLADDPALNVRLDGQTVAQPLRVIVDSALRTPVSARTLQVPGSVLIATAVRDENLLAIKRAAMAAANCGPDAAQVELVSFAGNHGKVDLNALLRYLAREKHCNEVLLESGARLAGAMMQAHLVDELITYIAPSLLGSDARPLLHLPGIEQMSQQLQLEIIDVVLLGKDCRMRSRVLNEQEPSCLPAS